MLGQKKIIGEMNQKSPKKSYVPGGGMAKFFKKQQGENGGQDEIKANLKAQNKNSVPMLFKQRKI